MQTPFMHKTDGYKLDHRRQYPNGTEYVLSNFTPRTSRPGHVSVPLVGLQYFLEEYFHNQAVDTFFAQSKKRVVNQYAYMLERYLGESAAQAIGTEHIEKLHDLQYLPLEVRAVPEGTRVPLRVPMFTIENTHPDFGWLTNYFETLISSQLWQPCTSAATALDYRQVLEAWATLTAGSIDGVQWQAHDFSFRGMPGVEAAALSGLGHLLSFTGTDCVPSLDLVNTYYSSRELVGGTVPATEHSVMCAGGQADELSTIERILDLYPTGIVSQVMDTWNLWHVLTVILPQLKDKVMARPGKLVVRPDSGDPVEILCGHGDKIAPKEPEFKGVIELLWDVFGGTVNAQGYKVLDPHIGAIYGDSITVALAGKICKRLAAKGFASTNVVFGVGSYTYQYVTRDTEGFAMKSTWAQVNGQERFLSKNPVTDTGVKKSATGRLAVVTGKDGRLKLLDGLTLAQQHVIDDSGDNMLRPVWRNGRFLQRFTLDDLRANIRGAG